MNPANLRIVPQSATPGSGVGADATARPTSEAAHFARRTLRAGADPRYNGTVSLFDPRAAGYQDPILVTANGCPGSKLKIAIATGNHETVGIDLVANTSNLLLSHGGEPLSFHYHHICGTADSALTTRILAGLAEGCRQAGSVLAGGRTIEMPGVFEDGEYGLSGYASGVVERIGLLPRYDLAESDVLLGLASSGPHSDGYGLIRRILTADGTGYREAAPFAPSMTIGQALTQPTRAYAPVVGAVLRATPAIKAIAAITQGGLQAGLTNMLPAHIAARVDLASWRLPPLFEWLRRTGDLSDADMLRAFNCGLGMVLVVDKLRTVSALKVLRDMGERPLPIGTLVNRTGGDAVRFSGALTG